MKDGINKTGLDSSDWSIGDLVGLFIFFQVKKILRSTRAEENKHSFCIDFSDQRKG